MIHVLDELTVRPGRLAEVRSRVARSYVPVVEPLGMRLTNTWISPAVELQDDPTDLLLLWELDDTAAYWAVKRTAARDADVLAFWHGLAPFLSGRARRVMVDPDDPDILR